MSAEPTTYTARVEIEGEVTSVDLDEKTFRVKLPGGERVISILPAGSEKQVADALLNHQTESIRLVGEGEFVPGASVPIRVIAISGIDVQRTNELAECSPLRSLGQLIEELIADIPEEDFLALPDDGAENHDRYLNERF